MEIVLRNVRVEDLCESYEDNGEGGVRGFGGLQRCKAQCPVNHSPDETTPMDNCFRLALSRRIVTSIAERAAGSPEKDPFAAKVQKLGARVLNGLPLSDPELQDKAIQLNDELEALRKLANEAVLGNE